MKVSAQLDRNASGALQFMSWQGMMADYIQRAAESTL